MAKKNLKKKFVWHRISPKAAAELAERRAAPDWVPMRERFIEERGRRCEGARLGYACEDTSGPFELDHRSYESLWHELPEHVLVLCHPCHKKVTREDRAQYHYEVMRDGWLKKNVGESYFLSMSEREKDELHIREIKTWSAESLQGRNWKIKEVCNGLVPLRRRCRVRGEAERYTYRRWPTPLPSSGGSKTITFNKEGQLVSTSETQKQKSNDVADAGRFVAIQRPCFDNMALLTPTYNVLIKKSPNPITNLAELFEFDRIAQCKGLTGLGEERRLGLRLRIAEKRVERGETQLDDEALELYRADRVARGLKPLPWLVSAALGPVAPSAVPAQIPLPVINDGTESLRSRIDALEAKMCIGGNHEPAGGSLAVDLIFRSDDDKYMGGTVYVCRRCEALYLSEGWVNAADQMEQENMHV